MSSENKQRRVRPVVVVISLTVFLGAALLWYLRPTPPPVVAPAPEPEPEPPAVVEPVAPLQQYQPPPRKRMGRNARYHPRTNATPVVAPAPPTLEAQWGIQVASLRLSMGDSILDLRYKVIDADKVAVLANAKAPAFLVDHETGKKLPMPKPPKEGAFPPSGNKLIAGKTYFSMISNQGGTLKSGSQVSVVVGVAEVASVTVE